MRKSVLVLFAVVFMAHNLFSQTIGERTWEKKYGFEEGLTQAFVIEATNTSEGNDSQYLLALNSSAGTINTYKVDKKTGAIGKLLFKKVLDKKGTWGAAIMGRRSLAISYADYGAFEILTINKDGSIGEKTYETNSFEKGISIVVPMLESTLLIKPNSGFAWLFDSANGKLGSITWQNQNWDKGMTAGICCHGGSSYVALTRPDGHFWIANCKNKKNVEIMYSTDKFAKGITTIASNPTKANAIMLADPSTGHQWGVKATASDVKVITDSPNWEKGLTVQAFAVFQSKYGYNIPKEGFLYVFKPEIGAVWVFKTAIN